MPTVPADISPNPVIGIVGEAPAEDEARAGKPFSGAYGRVLNSALGVAELPRDRITITNAVLEPVWSDGELTKRVHAEAEQIRARLREELAGCSAIVPMGDAALFACSGFHGITRARGCFVPSVVGGLGCVPSLHPSFIVRQWRRFRTLALDLEKAWKFATGELGAPKERRVYWVGRDIGASEAVLYLTHHKMLACDIETTRGQISCIGFAPSPYTAIVFPFVDEDSPGRHYFQNEIDERLCWEAVQELLALPIPKIFHNGAYDVYWLYDFGFHVRNWKYDTRLMAHALMPEEPRDLATLGGSYLWVPAWKLHRQATDKEE